MSANTMTTAFSGIDGPSTAANMLAAGIDKELGCSVVLGSHLNATEWNKESQYELMMHPHKPACLHTDVAEFFRDEAVSYTHLRAHETSAHL
eukprot:11784267-Alexandrium_andersonii.AAC.1